MGRSRLSRRAYLGVVGIGVAFALWLHADTRNPQVATGAQPGPTGLTQTAGPAVLAGRGRLAGVQKEEPVPAAHAAASDWEVVTAEPAGDPLVLEVPAPADESARSMFTLVANSSVGEMRWIGLIPEPGEPPHLFYNNPPGGIAPLAKIAERGTLGANGCWIVRTSLTSGRWLVRLVPGNAWAAESFAWGWVEAGAKGGSAPLPAADPTKMGRLRLWAHVDGQHAVTVRWRGFVWATGFAPRTFEDAEEWVVPADEDLLVSLGGYDRNGWAFYVPTRTVRVAPRAIADVGFEVSPMPTVRFAARPPAPRSGPVGIRVWRTDSGEFPLPKYSPREVAADSYEMHLPIGSYVAVATGPALRGSARATFRVDPHGANFVDLQCREAGSRFRLRLREADGAVAADVAVVLRRVWATDVAPDVEGHVTTDAEGNVDLGPVEAGRLQVLVEGRGLIRTIDVPTAADRTLDLRLPPTTGPSRSDGITIRVEEADGTPWPRGEAMLSLGDGGWAHYASFAGWHGEGYAFTNVAVGDYVLTLPPRHSSTRREGVTLPVTVVAGEHRRLVARPRTRHGKRNLEIGEAAGD